MDLALKPSLGAWTTPLKPALSVGELVVSRAHAVAKTGLETLVPRFQAPDFEMGRALPRGLWATLPPQHPVSSSPANTTQPVAKQSQTLAHDADFEYRVALSQQMTDSMGSSVFFCGMILMGINSLRLLKNLKGDLNFAEISNIRPTLWFQDTALKSGALLIATLGSQVATVLASSLLDLGTLKFLAANDWILSLPPLLALAFFMRHITEITSATKRVDQMPFYYAGESVRYTRHARETLARSDVDHLGETLLACPTTNSDAIENLADVLTSTSPDPYHLRWLIALLVAVDVYELLDAKQKSLFLRALRNHAIAAQAKNPGKTTLNDVNNIINWLECRDNWQAKNYPKIAKDFFLFELMRTLFHEAFGSIAKRLSGFQPATSATDFLRRFAEVTFKIPELRQMLLVIKHARANQGMARGARGAGLDLIEQFVLTKLNSVKDTKPAEKQATPDMFR